MTKQITVDETVKNGSNVIEQKLHIGNLKLSESKKAIKVHIFKPEQFFVIPLKEISDKEIGRVYTYVDGTPEVVGEIQRPKKGASKFYTMRVKNTMYHLATNYIELLLSETNLTLEIREE